MPIPDLTTLGFTAKEDSEYFGEEPVDRTIRAEMEGGFVQTRARFTRRKLIFSTGWTDIPHAQKVIFDAFMDSMRDGAGSFSYIHPVSADVFVVRFASPLPQPKYAGIGGFHRWNIPNVKLEEV